jgi:glycosyltransferase involved in cell wall biosynthesis
MNLIQITPGAGGMYCGNCFRDNALVAELRRQGHETVMVPLYLPMTLDEAPTTGDTPTFFGGINVFLSQKMAWYRRAPGWMRRLLDAPGLLKWAAGKTAKTRAEDVGELTVSMLRGEKGNQSRELEEMMTWLARLPQPDAVFLSNALLVGFARSLKSGLRTRVIGFLQSEESFLDSLPEPFRTEAWQVLAERARDVDGWIAPTRYFADRMSERLGLPSSSIHVVPNGISLAGYAPSPGAERPLSLGFFARMCPEKGLDTVVDAFVELRRRGTLPALKLRVGGGCGPGDLAFVAQQKGKLQAAGLLEDSSWHPNVSREDKITFLASCSVLSVPARTSEAFGMYVIEALAAGTPVVQPRASGFPEMIDATGGGMIYGDNKAFALADALEPLLLDPARLRRLGTTGQQAVRERFTDSVMARRTVETTRAILANEPSTVAQRSKSSQH